MLILSSFYTLLPTFHMNTLYFLLHCIYSTLEASYFSDFTYNKLKKYDALL